MYRFRFVLMLLVFTSIFSCNQAAEKNVSDSEVPNQIADFKEKDGSPAPPPPGNEGIAIERKLIKEGSLEYEVDNLQASRAQLLKAIAKWKGYVGNESEYNTSERNSTSIIIRVPATNFDSLLSAATVGIAYFDRKDISVKDVTEEYVDVEARLRTKKDIEKRYIELLKKANTVSEILEVEKELGELRTDIESIEGRLNVLKSEVAFSTLNITIYQTIGSPSFFGERIAAGFSNGWSNLLNFMVGLVYLWPFIVMGVFGYLGYRYWRKNKKGGK